MKQYNRKTSLMVCYQYHMLNNGNDVVLLSQDFDTLDEAYEAMEKVMPDDYYGDDGTDLNEWAEELAKGEDDDIFMQYNADIDKNHNVLAQLRPIIEEVAHD